VGKKKPKQEIVAYGMSIHFGVCAGPVDYMSNLIIDEKRAWPADWPAQLTGLTQLGMSLPDLFGGEKKEGGLVGLVTWLPGEANQVMPENLASRFSLTSATMPAYRGIASIFFSGPGARNLPGFYWRANSPYLPGVWVGVARASTDLNAIHARIYRSITVTTQPGLDLGVLGSFAGGSTYVWDTNGDYCVKASVGVADGGACTVITLPSGEHREFTPANLDGLLGRVHITEDMEIVQLIGPPTDCYLEFRDAATLTDVHTIDVPPAVGAYLYNFGFVCDDIVMPDDSRHLFGCLRQQAFNNWALLSKSSAADDWVLVATAAGGGADSEEISMGRQYAYARNAVSTNEVFRVEWGLGPPDYFDEVLMPPAGIGSRTVRIIHYYENTDEVIIVCGNGDLLIYSSDLSVLKRSRTGLPDDLGLIAGMACKRLDLGGGQIVLHESGPPPKLHFIDVATLGTAYTIDIPTSNFVNKTNNYDQTGVNKKHAGVFMAVNVGSQPSVFWFLPPLGPFDSNPAHIIYECLTNPNWGMGAPSSAIDIGAFEAAGLTLFNERFGLSMIWTQQASIEDFISEVLDHIEATLFVNPRTGLLTLKLIRNDYSIPSLPVFTPDNSVVTAFSRKLWGETINEIVVTWTNPDNEEEETVVAQDLANIEAQGGVISDGRNYYGVRRSDLAAWLAHRDLRSASTPLAKCDIEVNRSAWDLLPGDCCVLNSPEDGIDSIVMRVGPVDYGKPGDSTVRTSLMEDVFSLALADYSEPPESLWVDTSESPSAADHTEIVTLPYYLVTNLIDASIVAGVDYPEVFAGVLAAEAGQDTQTFELLGQETNAAGVIGYANFGTRTIASRATLAAAIAAEVETTILSFPDRTQGNGPVVGGLMLIEGADETVSEICLVSDLGVGGWTFKRGVLDTVPRAWPAGTPVWFVDGDMAFSDDTIRSVAETVNYKVLPTTSRGTLAESSAPVSSAVMTARPHLPLRPADVMVNSDAGFAGAIDCVGVDPIPVTWARRNRETETAIIKAWDDGDVTPEAGQTTTVTLTDTAGAVLHAYTGIAGTSYNVDVADFAGESEGYIVVSSERDGLESLQAWRAHVLLASSFTFEDGGAYEFEDGLTKSFED
jgi:hypothetical protein